MNDLISRQAAIDALILLHDHSDMPEDWHEGVSDAVTCLFRVPYVQPERNKGIWTKKERERYGYKVVFAQCSVCGSGVEVIGYNFCPNCGAEMGETDT